MIIVLAGRRIDAPGADAPRFPIGNVPRVRERIRAMLELHAPEALVCSAACGADLLALSEAGALGLRRRVILPFAPERFRETSVADRPGDWGPLYDKTLEQVECVVLTGKGEGTEAYAATNLAIFDEAGKLGKHVTAVLVWDGSSRGGDDLTAGFGDEARRRGLAVIEISTL
ncbi:MAG: hypothetical protein M3Z23_08795 [Acidobacteriota bacterium]|nr:hypothetical protein [Acidobacteriota bacterium]